MSQAIPITLVLGMFVQNFTAFGYHHAFKHNLKKVMQTNVVLNDL